MASCSTFVGLQLTAGCAAQVSTCSRRPNSPELTVDRSSFLIGRDVQRELCTAQRDITADHALSSPAPIPRHSTGRVKAADDLSLCLRGRLVNERDGAQNSLHRSQPTRLATFASANQVWIFPTTAGFNGLIVPARFGRRRALPDRGSPTLFCTAVLLPLSYPRAPESSPGPGWLPGGWGQAECRFEAPF
jgi:hypothetical protein